jgi:beta-phosphoglucomutase family hydrolase
MFVLAYIIWADSELENSKMPEGVIFDLDGVLVDTGPFHKQSWYDLAQKEDFQINDENFRSTFGMQNYEILPIFTGRDLPQKEIERLSDWKEQRYRELVSGNLRLLEGVEYLIKDLKNKGFLLAVGTSAPKENLTLIMDQLSLHDCFDAYVTCEDVTKSKPAPDTFIKSAQKLSLHPQHCIVVEDSVHGVQAAKAAGMKVVAVTNTRTRLNLAKADIIVDSLGQLQVDDFIELLRS